MTRGQWLNLRASWMARTMSQATSTGASVRTERATRDMRSGQSERSDLSRYAQTVPTDWGASEAAGKEGRGASGAESGEWFHLAKSFVPSRTAGKEDCRTRTGTVATRVAEDAVHGNTDRSTKA